MAQDSGEQVCRARRSGRLRLGQARRRHPGGRLPGAALPRRPCRQARAVSGLTTTRSDRWGAPLLELLGQAAGDVGTVYGAAMDKPDPPETNETEAERQRRLAWERERIAEADADIAAGRLIDEAEIEAWINSIGTEHELPPRRTGRRTEAC